MSRALRVQAADAERALRELQRARLLDGARRTERVGDEVLIPALDGDALLPLAASLGATLVEDASLVEREPRTSPREQVQARLPAELRALVPDKWEQHGDVLVLRLDDKAQTHGRQIARAFADVLDLKSVIHDPAGVAGELREMRGELLLGDDPVATHVENGIRYRFDASRVMFSSGNLVERMRAAQIPARDETVVDMFAGIGYFTLPLAVYARPARIHALEKNPVSFGFLQENARLNGVEGIVEPWLGDNRDFPREGIADRVLMGYVGGTRAFLPKAFALLKPEAGVVHLHDTAHALRWKEELTHGVLDAARGCGRVVAIEEARVVKSYSPGVVHAVVVARVRGPG